jgi:IS66 C-terminal element
LPYSDSWIDAINEVAGVGNREPLSVETCKLHGVDPQAYFADVLTKLVNLWPASRLDELMPWAWAAQRSADRLAA